MSAFKSILCAFIQIKYFYLLSFTGPYYTLFEMFHPAGEQSRLNRCKTQVEYLFFSIM